MQGPPSDSQIKWSSVGFFRLGRSFRFSLSHAAGECGLNGVNAPGWMAALPDLCEPVTSGSEDELDVEDYVFHNPLSGLAVVPDVVDFERYNAPRCRKRPLFLSLLLIRKKCFCFFLSFFFERQKVRFR